MTAPAEVAMRVVTAEIRGLVQRRRELLTMTGSLFAALGIFLENVLQGRLPSTLRFLEGHVFAAYALMLLVPGAIIGLRLALLNGGMALNGVLYARLMRDAAFGPKADLAQAGRINPFGVFTLMFLLVDCIVGFAAALLALSLQAHPAAAAAAGVATSCAGLGAFLALHRRGVDAAARRVAAARFAPPAQAEWQSHVMGSMHDANQDMTAVLGLVGLIVFSAFQGLSGLGAARPGADLPPSALAESGPAAYGLLMTVTCAAAMLTYVRLRLAAGRFALELDPEDRPFRAFRLTDSLLGYALIAFFFAIGVHVMLFPRLRGSMLFLATAFAFIAALAAEQTAVARASRSPRAPRLIA